MSMAGLGKPWEIWELPFHAYIALRKEYLAIVAPPKEEDEDVEKHEIAPGTTLEVRKQTNEA